MATAPPPPDATCFLCGQRGGSRDAPLVETCRCTCSVRPVAGWTHQTCLVLAEPRKQQGDTSPTSWRECPVCRTRGFGQAQLTRARQRFAAAQGDKLAEEWAKLGAAEELATALLASARDFPGALAVYDEALTVTRTERGERHPETLARTSQRWSGSGRTSARSSKSALLLLSRYAPVTSSTLLPQFLSSRLDFALVPTRRGPKSSLEGSVLRQGSSVLPFNSMVSPEGRVASFV